jgi:hypothetical protein
MQRFHQYQQNRQLPLILTELTEHKRDVDFLKVELSLHFWLLKNCNNEVMESILPEYLIH